MQPFSSHDGAAASGPGPRASAPPSFVSERAAVVRRNPWILGLAATPFGLLVADLLLALVLWRPQPLVVLPHLLAFGTAALIYAWRKNPYAREVPGKLEVDGGGVQWNGERLVARAELKDGMVLPRASGPPIVRLRRRGLRLAKEIRVSDRNEGRGLLRALGFDASQAVATFSLPSRVVGDKRLRRWLVGGVMGSFVLMGVLGAVVARMGTGMSFGPLLPVLWAVAISSIVLVTAVPTKLRVGADGLHVSWWRSTRFIPYGEVARVDPFEDSGMGNNRVAGLELLLKSKERVRIPILSKRSSIRDELYLVHERIAEAIETWSRGEGAAHAAMVRRSGRGASDWVRALKGIGAFANADARTAPVLPEKLWRIVEDPAAPADARAGAAVALGMSVDDEGRARLRAAADATAAPKLRVAIESAAKNEAEEALVAALEEVEAEEAHASKRA
jgi:hypothetical protein